MPSSELLAPTWLDARIVTSHVFLLACQVLYGSVSSVKTVRHIFIGRFIFLCSVTIILLQQLCLTVDTGSNTRSYLAVFQQLLFCQLMRLDLQILVTAPVGVRIEEHQLLHVIWRD